ncbi:hypothetical protein ASF61_00795 [Duganella sp. Leaf126]|uniref:hypothetical protein n=1 Tax=Duganella sp. Leaf126 TaxID=1736266 RepID=UPI0006F6015A|nr:hypothetical protein [Duganella sp. Leaf126]KQQ47225.1 hypothetical protein ASF61_00795 [Duganella sp. Leaf126]
MTTPANPRSDKLLPAEDQVAEEVNTDQQAPATRRIGQLPQESVGGQPVAEAVAEATHTSGADPTSGHKPDHKKA